MRVPSNPPSSYCWWGFQWQVLSFWPSAFNGAVLAGCWAPAGSWRAKRSQPPIPLPYLKVSPLRRALQPRCRRWLPSTRNCTRPPKARLSSDS